MKNKRFKLIEFNYNDKIEDDENHDLCRACRLTLDARLLTRLCLSPLVPCHLCKGQPDIII